MGPTFAPFAIQSLTAGKGDKQAINCILVYITKEPNLLLKGQPFVAAMRELPVMGLLL